MLEVLIDFLVIFVLVCVFYLFVINRNKKDFSKLKPNDFIRSFVIKYNISFVGLQQAGYKSQSGCFTAS